MEWMETLANRGVPEAGEAMEPLSNPMAAKAAWVAEAAMGFHLIYRGWVAMAALVVFHLAMVMAEMGAMVTKGAVLQIQRKMVQMAAKEAVVKIADKTEVKAVRVAMVVMAERVDQMEAVVWEETEAVVVQVITVLRVVVAEMPVMAGLEVMAAAVVKVEMAEKVAWVVVARWVPEVMAPMAKKGKTAQQKIAVAVVFYQVAMYLTMRK